MYELEAKKEELKEEEKMLLKCESFIKSIENTLKYL